MRPCTKCGKHYKDKDGRTELTQQEIEDLKIPMLQEQTVSITVEVKDTNGDKVSSPDYSAISGKLSLLGAYAANRYENLTVDGSGKLSLAKAVVGDYTVELDGYERSTFIVYNTTNDYTLTLQKTIAYGSNEQVTIVNGQNASITVNGQVTDYTGNRWSGSAELVLPAEVADSDAVILEFNVKNVTNSAATSGTDVYEWASQRIAIQMAADYKGFLFFLPKSEANIFEMLDGRVSNEVYQGTDKPRFAGGNKLNCVWLDTAMRGTSGVNMRIVRTGTNITLFAQDDKDTWVKIGTIEDVTTDTEIIFYGCGVEWKFSSISVAKLNHVAAVAAQPGGEGNLEHYKDSNNNYWLPDGTPTTAEDVVTQAPIDVTLNVTATALDGKISTRVPNGTVITLKGLADTYTYTVEGTALTQMYAGDYIVTADGYAQTKITVATQPGTASITVSLKKAITIGKGSVALTNKAWNGQQKLTVPQGLTAGNFTFEATLKASDFSPVWVLHAWQRYAIRLTQGNVGFYFWSWDDGTAKTHIRQFSNENLTNAEYEGTNIPDVLNEEYGPYEPQFGYITNALLSEEGLKIKIIRSGTTFTLQVMKDASWETLGTVTCAADDVADIELYAGVGTYEWSDVKITQS